MNYIGTKLNYFLFETSDDTAGFSSSANRKKTLTATTLYTRKLGIKNDWNYFSRTVMYSK